MFRRILIYVGGVLVTIAAITVIGMWRAGGVGTGPVATATAPDGPAREIAFVANAVGGTVTLIDLEDLTVVGEFSVVPDGERVSYFRDPIQSVIGQPLIQRFGGLNFAQDTDISPDGRVLYVARGHLGDVAAFDVASGDLMWRQPIAGFRADHMALSKDGRRLFVAAMTSRRVAVIDTATAWTVGRFTTGIFPHDNNVSDDGARIYNASLGNMIVDEPERGEADNAYLITVADVSTLEVLDTHRFERGIRPFQVTADESLIHAQLSNTHSLITYDVARREVIRRLDLPVKEGVVEDDWDFEAPHHGLVMTEDESTLCIAGRASDYVALVATEDLSLIKTIPSGDAPSWSASSAGDRYCVVANTRSDDVSVVSYATRDEVVRLPAGRGPKHVITIGRVPDDVLAGVTGR